MNKSDRFFPGGSTIFQRMFTRLGCEGRPPRFQVEFYAYTNLVLTIRRREEAIYVRFSDLMRQCSLPVLEGAELPSLSLSLTLNMLARSAHASASNACAARASVSQPPAHKAAFSISRKCSIR